MNQDMVVSKIKGVISILRVIEGVTAKLPAKWQREMPFAKHAIRDLEIIKAEILGEPWPEVPAVEVPEWVRDMVEV